MNSARNQTKSDLASENNRKEEKMKIEINDGIKKDPNLFLL